MSVDPQGKKKKNALQAMEGLLQILSTWDLATATAGSVRRNLETEFGVDLSNPECVIRNQINIFFEEEEEENEGKRRGRKRKRKASEKCRVSPQLQEFIGGGPEMVRTEVMKKILAYVRENDLQFPYHKHRILADDKLGALFPGKSCIILFLIDKLLSEHNHIQPLEVMEDDRKRITEAMSGRHEKCEGDMRPWDKMPRDIMVKIVKKLLPFDYSTLCVFFDLCRSWQLAVVDVMIPPNNVLDLRVLDSDTWKPMSNLFIHYLRIALNCRPASAWTTLYLPNKTTELITGWVGNDVCITYSVLTLIAQRTPELQNLYVPDPLVGDIFLKLLPNWKDLRRVHINISAYNFSDLQANCKFISELSLYGRGMMDDHLASMLAKHFQNLKSLEIRGCTIANRVLRIISDGHKNLKLLDTQDDDDDEYHYHFVEAHVAEKVNKENRRVRKSYIIPNINLAQKDIRRWDKLPQKDLLKIIKLLSEPEQYWVFDGQISSVCRSWQSTLVDTVFPPNNVLDLRVVDSGRWKSWRCLFFKYLHIVLNRRPARTWTTLYLPKNELIIDDHFSNRYWGDEIHINISLLTMIAERTPELRYLHVPQPLMGDIFLKLVPKWKNLRKVHMNISAYNISDLQANCKFISELSLYGRGMMDDHLASMLAKHFPNLKSLEIRGCTMSRRVLRIILEGHKNLKLLDTQDDDEQYYRFVEAHVDAANSQPEMGRDESRTFTFMNQHIKQD